MMDGCRSLDEADVERGAGWFVALVLAVVIGLPLLALAMVMWTVR